MGAWRDPRAGRWVAPSDSTLCRVLADTDPDALADVLRRWAAPRAASGAQTPALAADGKRIRGANRNTGDGVYFETVTLVTHQGRPLASRCCRDEGGEGAAAKALLEEVDVRGCLITLDALHTTYDTEHALVDLHGADYLFTVKGNCPETFAALAALQWNAPRVRHYAAPPEKGPTGVSRRAASTRWICPSACCASTRRAKRCGWSASAPSSAPASTPARPSMPSLR